MSDCPSICQEIVVRKLNRQIQNWNIINTKDSFVQWTVDSITTKRLFLNPIGYLKPWEITDKIFIITKTDDDGQTFENISTILLLSAKQNLSNLNIFLTHYSFIFVLVW